MNKELIRVAVVGFGNVGKYAIRAIKKSFDMELAGVVRRKNSPKEITPEFENVLFVNNIEDLSNIDVAILCCPSRNVAKTAEKYLSLGINTVDSFDIHGNELWTLRCNLNKIAKKNNAVSILAAGWDPGSDSVIRMLMEALQPMGITYTNFGPGMSMGHSVVAKSKDGVKNALSMTIPAGLGMHNRIVYVELEVDADFSTIEKEIKNDEYFSKNFTEVKIVDNVNVLIDTAHAVMIERKPVSDEAKNHFFEFRMKINNPEITANIMVSCARATMNQNAGAYTMPEIPVIDLLAGSKEALVKKLI